MQSHGQPRRYVIELKNSELVLGSLSFLYEMISKNHRQARNAQFSSQQSLEKPWRCLYVMTSRDVQRRR